MDIDKCTGNYHPRWFGLAVQALVYLSRESQQKCPSVEIAATLQSEPTLIRRVLAVLAREGFLETKEGRDGGFQLKRAPETITLDEVYDAFRAGSPLCFGIKDTTGDHAFGLEMRRALGGITDELDRSMRETLSKHSIAEIAQLADAD